MKHTFFLLIGLLTCGLAVADQTVFYCTYQNDECIEASAPVPVDEVPVEVVLSRVLDGEQNFIGFVDDAGTTLQFYVDQKDKVWVEIPSPKDQGSFGRQMSNEEVLQLVQTLKAPFMDYIGELGLSFSKW